MASILTILGPLSWLSSILVWWRLRKWNDFDEMWYCGVCGIWHQVKLNISFPDRHHHIWHMRFIKPAWTWDNAIWNPGRKYAVILVHGKKISPAVFNKDVSLGKKKGWRRVSYDYRHEEFYWLMMIIAMKSAACFGEAQVRGACQSIKSVFITAFVIQIIILKKRSSKKSLFSFIADKCWKFNVNVYRSSNT